MQRIPTYRAFGLRTLSERLNVFVRTMQEVRELKDEDAIHDLRVASRRFHAATLLFSDSLPSLVLANAERRIRRVRKSAGEVRDGDVQMEFIAALMKRKKALRYRAGLERLLLRLSQRREKQMKQISTAMDTFDRSTASTDVHKAVQMGITRQPGIRTLPLRHRSGQAIVLALNALLRYEQYIRQSSATAELHQMRIAAKRLRYVMEIFNPVYGGKLKPFIHTIRSLQDALGLMHDCDVWLSMIPEFIEEERLRTGKFFGATSTFPRIERGLLFLTDYVRVERMKQYRKFVRIWNEAGMNSVWKAIAKVTVSPPRTFVHPMP